MANAEEWLDGWIEDIVSSFSHVGDSKQLFQ